MRLTPRPGERRPDPPPLATDDARTVIVGTVVWGVLLVLALLFRGWLADTGRGWWVWTPVVGIALGLYGLRYLARRRRGVAPGDPTP